MSDNPLEQFLNKKAERAAKWREVIEDMLSSGLRYQYAEPTLLGILEHIEENGDISDAQIQAVENIKEKPSNYGW